jgi:NDP-sugar pyrophosphorylase family protein
MKRAVVLAGGVGRRLAPYTTVLPKPLMPLGDMSILEVVIRQLAHCGFKEITLAVGHLSELIMAVCGTGSKWGVDISYSPEERPLGTAGPLALIKGLDEPFLVMNGDILTTLDYAAFYRHHLDTDALITVATAKRQVEISLGVLELDDADRLKAYIEKPEFDYQVSMGVYVMDPEVIRDIAPGDHLDLPDLVRSAIALSKAQAYCFDGYWKDIGSRSDYEVAVTDFERMRLMFLPNDEGQEDEPPED